MGSLSNDAKGFVDGVSLYLNSEKKRSDILPRVTALFRKVTSQTHKTESAHVQSATTLTPQERQKIERYIHTLINHTITTRYSVDRKLIGGMKIIVSDWIVDTSLLSQLNELVKNVIH